MNEDIKVQENLAASLTAESVELLPHIPYLLQDLWELGGTPAIVAELLHEYSADVKPLRVLDIACGKGAVSVWLAKKLGAIVKGVDIMPEFIQEAQEKADEFSVSSICHFEVGDANDTVAIETGWDCVVFSAAGDILGSPQQTLEKLMKTIRPGGYIVLDESCLGDLGSPGALKHNHAYLRYSDWNVLFADLKLTEIDRVLLDETQMQLNNRRDLENIRRRAKERTQQYPEKEELFLRYLKSQQNETDDIENTLLNYVWLLQKQN